MLRYDREGPRAKRGEGGALPQGSEAAAAQAAGAEQGPCEQGWGPGELCSTGRGGTPRYDWTGRGSVRVREQTASTAEVSASTADTGSGSASARTSRAMALSSRARAAAWSATLGSTTSASSRAISASPWLAQKDSAVVLRQTRP
jgi:hypothetical protein